MNEKILSSAAGFVGSIGLTTIVFFFLGFQGATLESAGIMLVASFLGFGVARYYATTAAFEANRRHFTAGGGSAALPSESK